MLHTILDLILGWVCAVVMHEAGHALVGRSVGMTVTGVNLLCQAGPESRSIFNGRVLFQRSGVAWGISLLSGGSVNLIYPSDLSAGRHIAVDLAGPLANLVLAVVFYLQGENMLMMVNLFHVANGSHSDLSNAIGRCRFFAESARRACNATKAVFTLVALPVVVISMVLGGWYYVIAVYTALSYLGALLIAQSPGKASAVATA